jgi:DNA helicase II / ATP-dependent DNA helicase PcrA
MFRIFGPPGTGKTTRLLNMVDRALQEGVPSKEIAFLAFTRKAAREAKERASERFKLDPESDLPYFRTIHSLAYRMLGIRRENLMQEEHFRELAQYTGISLTTTKVDEDGEGVESDHPALSLINLARLKKVDLRTEYNASNLEETWAEVEYINRSYTEYKESRGLLDYTDMLEKFAKEAMHRCPRFKLCFMDEAQDLSPMQWDIAHALDDISDRMYCAGDDDQAIYRWAGADVDHFINLKGGSETLDQSYRIPADVHHLATQISSRIKYRFPKTYKPRTERGMVSRIHDLSELDLSEGSWLIMAQANYMLFPVASDLKMGGYLFERNGQRSISEKVSSAINGWEQLRKGRSVDVKVAQSIYDYMSGNGIRIARGHKKINLEEGALVTMDDLRITHGLNTEPSLIWSDAMDKLPSLDRVYITALLRRGEKFNAKPRIKLSTIHGTKGGEADNVVVFTDLSFAANEHMNDDLHRVFYVAITRTRENLFLVEPEDATRSYHI